MWLGEGISVLGTATTAILLPLLAITQFDVGAAWLGALVAATWLPWPLFGLFVGAWVDNHQPLRVMIVADLVSAAALLSVPVAWVLDVVTLQQLLAVAFIPGTCAVFFRAAYPALLTRVVAAEQLEDANSKLVTTESVMDIVGPGIGGPIAQFVGAAWGLGLDGISFLASALCLSRVTEDPALVAEATRVREADGGPEPFLAQVRAGLRLIFRDRLLRFFVLQGGVSNLGLAGSMALMLLFLLRECGLNETEAGLVIMIGSIGGVVGAWTAPRFSDRLGSARAVVALTLLGGPPALLIAFAGPGIMVGFVMAALFLMSFGVLGENVVKGAWRQRYVPSPMLGRAVATSQLINYGALPIAGVLAGWLGSVVSLRWTIVLLVGIHALAALAILVSPIAGHRSLPVAPPVATPDRPSATSP